MVETYRENKPNVGRYNRRSPVKGSSRTVRKAEHRGAGNGSGDPQCLNASQVLKTLSGGGMPRREKKRVISAVGKKRTLLTPDGKGKKERQRRREIHEPQDESRER